MEKALHSSVAQALPDGAPDWVHLVPAGTFSGEDGRGPFHLGDATAVIAASMPGGRKLPIDENHSIDLLGKTGAGSPARGWIVEMQSRADGIWGRVEWTGEGRSIVEGKGYGFISPVFAHSKASPHRIARIMRAALTNDPNLTTLTSLHSTSGAHPLDEELKKLLGLKPEATDAEVLAAVTSAHAAQTASAATIARIAEAAGVAKDATADAVVTAINAKGAPAAGDPAEVKALRDQVTSLNTQLTQVVTASAKKDAETAIDAAIKAGQIVPALRDHMITRHMRDPAEVVAELKLMPSITGRSLHGFKPDAGADGTLRGEDEEVCALMGLDPKAFAETAKTISRGA